MKRFFLTLSIAILVTSTGCIREGMNECPPSLSLIFTHGSTTEGFDARIGNDVQLQVYYGGVWHANLTIPYQQIAGGQSYNLEDIEKRNVQFIAYAVSQGANGGILPSAAEGTMFARQAISMQQQSASRAPGQYQPKPDDIFAGTLSIGEAEAGQSAYVIPMPEKMCRVRVILEGTNLFAERFPHATPSIGLLGTTRSVTTYNDKPDGMEIEVASGFTAQGDNLETPEMRVLPSPDGQKELSLIFYKAPGEPAFPTFNTGVLSAADRDVVIVYSMGSDSVTITLTVDGWAIREETIVF